METITSAFQKSTSSPITCRRKYIVCSSAPRLYKKYRAIAITLACLLGSGCTSWAIDRAKGETLEYKYPKKEILEATLDEKSLRICFSVGNQSTYTAVAPHPELEADHYHEFVFKVESLTTGCTSSVDVHANDSYQPTPMNVLPRVTGIPGKYGTQEYIFRYSPVSGHYMDVSIQVPPMQISPNPAYYALVPLTVLVDIVAIPIYVTWIGICGSSCK